MEHRGDKSRDNGVVQEISSHILEAYGSLQEPNFLFEQQESRQKRYEPLVRDLAAFLLMGLEPTFTISNTTDLNTDHAYTFTLESTATWLLELSFVGPYAALFRATTQGGIEIVEAEHCKGIFEQRLNRLLKAHNVLLLSKHILETPINLKLFDTEPENVKFYQALFRDIDILPWRSKS